MKVIKRLYPHFAFLAFTLLVSFPLFKMEYSTDTYHFALWDGLSGISSAMDYNGRFFISFVARVCDALGMSFNGFYYLSFIAAIIFTSLSSSVLYLMLRGHMKSHLAFLISIITVFNPMIMELFLFIEKGFFMLSVFVSILSLKAFVAFMKGKRFCIVFALLLLPYAAFSYQALPNAFVTLALVFIIIYSKNIREFILNTICAVFIYGFSTALNYIVMRVSSQTERMGSGFSLANIYKYFTFNLSKWYMLFIWVAIFGALFLAVFGSERKKHGKWLTRQGGINFFNYSFLILGSFLGACAPGAFAKPDQAWLMLRTAYPLGMLIGACMILHFYKVNYEPSAHVKLFNKSVRGISVAIVCTVLCITVYLHTFFFSRLITNKYDFEEAYAIGQAIEAYEKESGNKIYYVAIYYDKSMKDYYDGTVKFSDCNVRALSRPWSDTTHLELILGRTLVKIKPESQYLVYFANQDWDCQSSEQFIFEGNTLHLCVY